MGRIVDLSGKKFGSLMVIEQLSYRSSDGDVMWLCKCDCGEMYHANGRNLRTGRLKSCGCYRKVPDLTGYRFGKLVAVSRAENIRHEPVWLCKCDCGTSKLVFAHNLIGGNSTSCGCVHNTARAGKVNTISVQGEYRIVRVGTEELRVSQRAYKRFYKLGYNSVTDEQLLKLALQLCELGVAIRDAKRRL